MTPGATTRTAVIAVLFATTLASGCGQGSDGPLPPLANTTFPPQDTPPIAGRALITSVTPSEVTAGATITVAGSGFGTEQGTSALTVGGASATSIVSWSDTEITAVVPADALTGPVKARVQGTDSDGKPLVVLWDAENPENVIVGGYRMSPLFAQLLSDGEGGALVVWNDYRNYDPAPPDPSAPEPPPTDPQQINIYAQRLNSRGKILWPSSGVALSGAAGGQWLPQIVSDGSGGAIVVWQDHRNGADFDIYAQRMSRAGDLVWASNVAVCAASGNQEKPKLVADGAGGAIVVWHDYRSGSRWDVYAQRIDGNGVPRWTPNGAVVSTAGGSTDLPFPEVVSDDAGGGIVVWQEVRAGARHAYAQRIDSTGAASWTPNGVRVSAAPVSYQWGVPPPVADGTGGAIVVWESAAGDAHAQQIDGSGALRWGSAGTVVSASPGEQLRMTTDGSGGVIIAWEDCRVGSAWRDIYAQRVSASGAPLWTADGVPVCTAVEAQYEPRIVSDGKGGAIVTWYDYRDYMIPVGGTIQGVDTYAQRLDADGVSQWQANGAAISTAPLHQMYPEIVSDHSGGAIIVWEDSRAQSSVALYAQGISFNGRQ